MKKGIITIGLPAIFMLGILSGTLNSCTDIQGDGIGVVIWEGSVLPEDSCFRNPVWEPDLSYPTVFSAAVGYFAFGAGNEWSPGLEYIVPVLSSNDLMNWRLRGEALTEAPDWSPGRIERVSAAFAKNKGTYYLFYQMSEDSIGMGISRAPQGPYNDFGSFIAADDLGFTESSNPFFFPFGSRAYLFLYDETGMQGIELGLERDTMASVIGTPFQVTGPHISGMSLIKRTDFYYLFGVEEDGENSTIIVGRSLNVNGPFLDKDGVSLLEGGGTRVLTGSTEKGLVSVNHIGGVFEDSNKELWMLYQVTDMEKPLLSSGEERHPLMLTKMIFDGSGWPADVTTPTAGWNYPKFPK